MWIKTNGEMNEIERSLSLRKHEINSFLELTCEIFGVPACTTTLSEGGAGLSEEVIFIVGLAVFFVVEILCKVNALSSGG